MAPEAESRSKYYTGEAYWALARLHLLFPDEGFGAVADRIGNYLATAARRRRGPLAADPRPLGRLRAGRDGDVPRARRRRAADRAELAYARRQAGLFGSQVRWVSQQAGPWGSLVRGTHGAARRRLRRRRRGADRAVARRRGRRPAGRRPRPAGRRGPTCIAGLAVEVQGRDGPVRSAAPTAPGSSTTSRGWTTSSTPSRRCCARSAIVEAPDGRGHDAPSAWLWGTRARRHAATRCSSALGRAPPRARRADRATLAARRRRRSAALIVVVAAALSGPLLDALDVSRPALRLAVGIVGAVAGLIAPGRAGRRPPGRRHRLARRARSCRWPSRSSPRRR